MRILVAAMFLGIFYGPREFTHFPRLFNGEKESHSVNDSVICGTTCLEDMFYLCMQLSSLFIRCFYWSSITINAAGQILPLLHTNHRLD